MFKAFVIVCHIMQPNVCMIATDNRGPYLTEFKCQMRLTEMTRDIRNIYIKFKAPLRIKTTGCVDQNHEV